jgi:hypothetical protein
MSRRASRILIASSALAASMTSKPTAFDHGDCVDPQQPGRAWD